MNYSGVCPRTSYTHIIPLLLLGLADCKSLSYSSSLILRTKHFDLQLNYLVAYNVFCILSVQPTGVLGSTIF